MALRLVGAGAVGALVLVAALAAADAVIPLPMLPPAPSPPALDPARYAGEAGDIAAGSFDVPEEEAQAAVDRTMAFAVAEGQRAEDAANTAVDLSLRASDRVVAAALRGRVEIPFTELSQLSALATNTARGANAGALVFTNDAATIATAVAVQKRNEATAAAVRTGALAQEAGDAAQDAGQEAVVSAAALVEFQSDEVVAVASGTFDTALVAAGTTAEYVLTSESRVCDDLVRTAQGLAAAPPPAVPPQGPVVPCVPGSVGAAAQEAALRLAADAEEARRRVTVEAQAFVEGTEDVACQLGRLGPDCLLPA